MTQKFTDAEIDHLIESVNTEASKPLTAWETQFIESITDQWERRRHLSEAQIEILDRIYTEKT